MVIFIINFPHFYISFIWSNFLFSGIRLLNILCNHKQKFNKLVNIISKESQLNNLNIASNLYKIKYLRYCILEILRLNGPVVTVMRELLQDQVIIDRKFKKGTQFIILQIL